MVTVIQSRGGKQVRSRRTPPSDLEQLRNVVSKEWNRIDQTDIQNLIEGLNRRMVTVIQSRGAYRVVSSGSYIYYVTWIRKQGRIVSRIRGGRGIMYVVLGFNGNFEYSADERELLSIVTNTTFRRVNLSSSSSENLLWGSSEADSSILYKGLNFALSKPVTNLDLACAA
ncbi:hypothetical protein ANN_03261 [Periplaneta americana]|uniref:Uncharacterized protein n=1 Tax=Periplaneta americana TaxID=6978 RepID=A0ABQ8U2I5_PERAM|nr:hypothetical protein ANN_03261 [Periplaneta americana]